MEMIQIISYEILFLAIVLHVTAIRDGKRKEKLIAEITKIQTWMAKIKGSQEFPFEIREVVTEIRTSLENIKRRRYLSQAHYGLYHEQTEDILLERMNTFVYEHVATEGYTLDSLISIVEHIRNQGYRGFKIPTPTYYRNARATYGEMGQNIAETPFFRMVADQAFENIKQTEGVEQQIAKIESYQKYAERYITFVAGITPGTIRCPDYSFFGIREREVWKHMESLANFIVFEEVGNMKSKIFMGMNPESAALFLKRLDGIRKRIWIMDAGASDLILETCQEILENLRIEGDHLRQLAESSESVSLYKQRKENKTGETVPDHT